MVGMGIHFPCNEKDCVIPKPHYKSEHDPARRGEGAHECSHDFFAGVCRICGTPQPTAQEASFEEWHPTLERHGVYCHDKCLTIYRRGRAEEREEWASQKFHDRLHVSESKVRELEIQVREWQARTEVNRAENARLREPFCMVTGFQSERGVCPEHRGDACLLMPVEFAKKLAATERELKWVGDVLAANGFPYSGPFGPGVCPLDEWLKDAEQREKRLLERIAEGEK